jgi:hypothetical protein
MPNTKIKKDQKRELQFSVKKEDGGSTIQFILPYYSSNQVLPPELPDYNGLYGYNQAKERLLLSTPRAEGQWANAIGIAIAKMASLNWAVESNTPLRIKRAQEFLLNAGAGLGIFGWVPFLSAHLGAFLAIGRSFIEIERATPANGSKVINIHHLNPLKCRLTGDSQYPVNYMSGSGVRKLGWHQVIVIVDGLDPTEGEMNITIGAAERSYKSIAKLAALENYIYEKISGRRPQSLYFLGGAIQRHIDDAIEGSALDADRQGLRSFRGAAVQAVPGDVPLSLVEIALAELPDGFDAVQERERGDLSYSNSIGLDPQDLNPSLVGRQGLGGTGNQSVVLARKQRGRGLSAWMSQFSHAINELALTPATLFTFSDPSPEERQTEADISKTRAETRKIQIEDGEITADQARNLAVDEGDLPREFIEVDETGGNVLADDDKILAETKPTEIKPEDDSEVAQLLGDIEKFLEEKSTNSQQKRTL